MTDTQWLTAFIVSLIIKIITSPKEIVNWAASFGLIVAGGILLVYSLQPQKYEDFRVDNKQMTISKGDKRARVEVPIFLKKETTSYLGGLVKDTSTKWIEE